MFSVVLAVEVLSIFLLTAWNLVSIFCMFRCALAYLFSLLYPDFRSAFRLPSHICQMSHIFFLSLWLVLGLDSAILSYFIKSNGIQQYAGAIHRKQTESFFLKFSFGFCSVRLAHQITKQKSILSSASFHFFSFHF